MMQYVQAYVFDIIAYDGFFEPIQPNITWNILPLEYLIARHDLMIFSIIFKVVFYFIFFS